MNNLSEQELVELIERIDDLIDQNDVEYDTNNPLVTAQEKLRRTYAYGYDLKDEELYEIIRKTRSDVSKLFKSLTHLTVVLVLALLASCTSLMLLVVELMG